MRISCVFECLLRLDMYCVSILLCRFFFAFPLYFGTINHTTILVFHLVLCVADFPLIVVPTPHLLFCTLSCSLHPQDVGERKGDNRRESSGKGWSKTRHIVVVN